MKSLLVIVDMLEGFLNEGNLADKKIQRIVPSVVENIEYAKKKGYQIIAFKDTHEIDDPEFNLYPSHCIRGSKECELIPQIAKYEKDIYTIEKSTTNGFETKEFKNFIRDNQFDNVVVTGCCSDICVYNFVFGLISYFKANNIHTNIIVPEDAVDTFNLPNHIADIINLEYLGKMEKIGVKILRPKVGADEKAD